MANYTENYDLVKPTMAETADIRTINGNMDTVDAIMHDTQVSMADAFDSTKSYAIREKCMYEFKLYQCIHPHTGPWDAEDFERVNAADTGGNYVEITPTYQSGLKIADTNIDGDLDEIDVPYFGGATAQENGTGGAVPAPTSSDVGKFLSSNGGWEIPSGGGGGTTVVPNPVGEPTDELETVRIGDTIFSIPGSGGGAGGSVTNLYTGTQREQTVSLSDNLNNYDAVIISFSGSANNDTYRKDVIYNAKTLSIGDNIGCSDDISYLWYDIVSMTSLGFHSGSGTAYYIKNIVGLNFGGSGNGYDSTLLWDYVNDNNGTIPYGTYTETLRDDINNYNEIKIEFASAKGDLTNVDWDSTVFVTLSVEALNNAWNSNKTNITTFGERSSRFYIHDNILQKTIDNQGDTNGLIRVYGIKFGSGGSGGSELTDDVIYEDTTGTTGIQNITLTERLDKYDAIYFEFYFPSETTYANANPTALQRIIEAPTGATNKYFVQSYPSYGNRYILFESTDGGTNAKLTTSAWGENIYPSIYRIHGIKFGGGSSGKSAEVIPITAGDNTTSRTFTFDKTPKFIKVYFEDATLDGGWALDSEIAWGQEYVNYKAHNMTVSVTGLTGGLSSISYGSDGKSMTITSGNAFGSYNSTNGSGFMFVDYGSGSGGTEVEANPEDPATDVLNTIKIGDTVYNIPGSSSGGNTRSDVLWSGSETTNAWSSPIEIDDLELDNYDLLSVEINRGQQLLIKNQIPEGDDSGNECLAVGGYPTYQISDTTKTWPVFFNRTGNTLRIFTSTGQSLNITKVIGLKFGGLYTEELSDMTWTELTSVAGATSSAIPIPDGTKYLLLTSELGTNMNIVAYESIDTINKAITESGISTWNKGYEYYDISGNHTNIAMAVSNGEVTIKSGYQTVTAKVYALSGGVRPYENKVLAPMIYSTEEREVGTWIDNKPLYQKTYDKRSLYLADSAWSNNILGTTGIHIVNYEGYFCLGADAEPSISYSYYRSSSEYFTATIDSSYSDINIRPNMNYGAIYAGLITIWYTKNSDVPGSGSYNIFGELMHHYSTEEKVVGTWIDGNTLYEKSYTNFSSLTGQSRTLDFQLSGIDKIWYLSEGCLISNGTYPFPYIHYDAANAVGGFWDLSIAGSPKFEFRTGSQSTSAVINVFTIRYTKTTS